MRFILSLAMLTISVMPDLHAQTDWPRQTAKPPLHARHWIAITGKPLAATAGAMIFQKGGNAVDAACAMLAATSTMWDVLSWGGETQALIYHPGEKRVIGVNALGVAPTGATAEFFTSRGMRRPPDHGPLAAVTPGTPGGLMVMLAEYGRLSLAEVLEPAIQMADGYPIEAETADRIHRARDTLRLWRYTDAVMLPHKDRERQAPVGGEIFVQRDLAAMLRRLVDAEQQALRAGRTRHAAIMVAYDRFYRGDIAEEFVRGLREEGGMITMQDLASWRVRFEEPVRVNYRGIDVYKLTVWTQGPAMLQALNILENADLRSMGYNSPRYIHTIYQAMNLAFADRDFYYGDIYFPPEEPVRGLLSKDYARARYQQINWQRNDPAVKPGDPYPYQGGVNPYTELLARWDTSPGNFWASPLTDHDLAPVDAEVNDRVAAGTTSIEAADAEGWVVSVTPSGGWVPAVIAGRTGIGVSQRAQSFVTDPADGPFNVVEPGKQPRVTLTPTMALKDGLPYLSFAVQGGDTQDQNLLQFFLNVVEFGATVQQATEAPNINSFQMRPSLSGHRQRAGRMTLASSTPDSVRRELESMGYTLEFRRLTSGPINAILFDRGHGTMWGGSSNHGEDYGVAW